MKRTKRYLFSFLFSLVMLAWLTAFLVGCSQTTATPGSSADTDTQEPYIGIGSWQDLQNITNNLAIALTNDSATNNYVQTNDITFPNPGVDGFDMAGFMPIGSDSTPFNGSYNGNGYSISNFYINRTGDYIGLFGYVKGANTVIENVRLSISNVTTLSSGSTVGALAGEVAQGTIRNVEVVGNGTVTTRATGGGIVGRLGGDQETLTASVINSYSEVNVRHNSGTFGILGGLVGNVNTFGTVIGYATGTVGSGASVGSLVGSSEGSIIGYATGRVFSNRDDSGLVAEVSGTPSIIGYWDEASTGQTNSAGGGQGISSIANVHFANGIYEDRRSGATNRVFNNATFLQYFNLPGASFTWPTLKPVVNQ